MNYSNYYQAIFGRDFENHIYKIQEQANKNGSNTIMGKVYSQEKEESNLELSVSFNSHSDAYNVQRHIYNSLSKYPREKLNESILIAFKTENDSVELEAFKEDLDIAEINRDFPEEDFSQLNSEFNFDLRVFLDFLDLKLTQEANEYLGYFEKNYMNLINLVRSIEDENNFLRKTLNKIHKDLYQDDTIISVKKISKKLKTKKDIKNEQQEQISLENSGYSQLSYVISRLKKTSYWKNLQEQSMKENDFLKSAIHELIRSK